MKEYLEQVLHENIGEIPYQEQSKLPLGCRNAFEMNLLKIGQQEFLMAAPIESMNLTELRKMRLRLERYSGYLCAFYLKKVNWYAAPKMIEEGIPFVWEDHQVYLPFLGMLLQKNRTRIVKNCTTISFLTQKLLLKALYENWQGISAVQAAELLEVSKMSITRCYDEIEALGMPFLKTQRRSRKFHAITNRKEMWETMLPFLRDPVIRTFRPETSPCTDMILSGTSALAEYSMLDENVCTNYGVTKKQIGNLGLNKIREVPLNEEPACIIHELGYLLSFGNQKAVDPLSLTLILKDIELDDPRVESCMNEMLEEWVW